MDRGIIFDWGGVLMRTHDHAPRHRWDAHLGLPPGSTEARVHGGDTWRQAQLGRISLEAHWHAVGEQLRLPEEALSRLRQDFYAGDQLDRRLVDSIASLRHEGFRIGLLSNNSLDLIETLHTLGLRSLFDSCIISAQIGIMKPDPAAYHAVLANLTLEAHQCLFFDDFLENVEGARQVGLTGIVYRPDMDVYVMVKDWMARSC